METSVRFGLGRMALTRGYWALTYSLWISVFSSVQRFLPKYCFYEEEITLSSINTKVRVCFLVGLQVIYVFLFSLHLLAELIKWGHVRKLQRFVTLKHKTNNGLWLLAPACALMPGKKQIVIAWRHPAGLEGAMRMDPGLCLQSTALSTAHYVSTTLGRSARHKWAYTYHLKVWSLE